MQNVTELALKGAATGLAAAGLSYLVLGRKQASDLFGMDMPHWAVDGIVAVVSSASADVIGVYALPMVEKAVGAGGSIADFVNMAGIPVLAGAAQYGVNSFATEYGAAEGWSKEFLLGAASKLIGDRAWSAYSGKTTNGIPSGVIRGRNR